MKFALQTIVFILFIGLQSAWAQTFPEYTSTTVNDFAALLPETEAAALHDRLTALNRDAGIEMTVVTLPSQTPYAPDMTMEAFATALFDQWGVGDAKRNDGILVLVLPEDRAMRIELGAGFAQAWNDRAARIVERDFLPRFREGNYATGIMDGADAIIDEIAIPFSEGAASPPNSYAAWVVIGLVGTVFVALFKMRSLFDLFLRLQRCPQCGTKGSLRVSRRTLMHATTMSGGQEEKTTYCTQCDYRDVKHWRTAKRSSSTGSSGRSSFGGGRSGGGGASGRW